MQQNKHNYDNMNFLSMPTIVGPLQFSSADQQQANEIKRIHEVVESTSSIILLGDFNHGPATPGITWNVPLNFGLMTARGLFSANALWCGQCTYCTDNILTGGSPNYLIDHIYLPTSRVSDVIRVEVRQPMFASHNVCNH